MELHYYVDSVNGLDSNNGLTEETAYKTLLMCINSLIQNTEADVTIHLADGRYDIDTCGDIGTGELKRIKNFFKSIRFLGKGIGTILNISSRFNGNAYYYNSQMRVYFTRLIITKSASTQSYYFMSQINQIFENVLFLLEGTPDYGYITNFSGYTNTFKNCTFPNGYSFSVSMYHGGICNVEKCYGKIYIKESGSYASNLHITDSIFTNTESNNAVVGNKYLDKLYRQYGVYGGEYKWGEVKLLIKQGDRYFTIKDNVLLLIDEEITKDVIKENGVGIDYILENQDLLANEFQLISGVNINCIIHNIQSNKQLVVASNNFSTKITEHIDYFKAIYQKNSNSDIKIAFSTDNGVTWRGNNFEDLNIEIPLKPYSDLTEEEKTKWNEAKEVIATNGINIEDLEALNFNTLDFEYIRFAYVLSVTSATDICNTSKLQWQFDAKGSMKKMKDSEYDIEVLPQTIKLTPLVETEMIKVNILS